jgi:RNA polymerase sigma factor (sigma-70 family)
MSSVAHPIPAPFRRPGSRSTVVNVGSLASSTAGADEAALAQRAAAGDGDAFAILYERYEARTFNLCYRILGSEDDARDATQEAFVNVLRRLPKLEGRELAFGSYVFTSARNACYDLIQRRKRAEPTDELPEYATPVGGGVGGGGFGFDPGDPGDDPERNVLLEARQEEIRAANLTLPERQREALALRELEGLSYDEIAEIMEMNRNSVAQLISRARINLRDALRDTALTSIAAASPDCERALPMIAAHEDGQLDEESDEADWLLKHMITCDTCRLSREAMAEAGVSYRAWLPVAAGPVLFRETMAEAAELVGADWTEVIERHEAKRRGQSANGGGAGGAGGGLASAAAGAEGARASILPHRRLDAFLMATLATILLLVALVGGVTDGELVETAVPVADERAAGATEALKAAKSDQPAKPKKPRKRPKEDRPAGGAAAPPDEPDEPDEPGDEPADDGGSSADQPDSNQERPRKRGRIKDPEDEGGDGELEPGTTEEEPPPPPPEEDPPVTDPPPEDPGCRDANGRPIECPPPPRCVPGRPCPPPRGIGALRP